MPRSRYSIHRYSSAELAATGAASEIMEALGRSRGPFHLAIPGGRSPVLVFQELVRLLKSRAQEQRDRGPLDRLRIFWVDERAVSPDAPESNYGLALSHLVGPLGLRPEQVFRIRGELGAQAAAEEYDETLKTETAGQGFHMALLGMGADGHVASIFPGDPRLGAGQDAFQLAYAAKAPAPPNDRISVSMDFLNLSGAGILLALGGEKHSAFTNLLDSEPHGTLPASYLDPARFKVICDEACRSGKSGPS